MSTKTGAYDLVYVPDQWIQQYAAANYLTNLNKYVKDSSLTPSSFNLADLSSNARSVYSRNGNLYAMPYFVQTPLMVYNKSVLKSDGISVPKTWTQMLAAAATLKAKGSSVALPLGQSGGANADILLVLASGNNGSLFTKSGKLDLTNPKVVAAANFIQKLSKYGTAGSEGWAWDDVNKVLQFGQAPLGISTSGLFTALEDPTQSKVSGKLGYAPLPYNKKVSGLIESWGWGVPADSKHKEAAYKLVEWLDSKAQLTTASKNDPSFVSFRASVNSDKQLVKNEPWLPAFNTALAQGIVEPNSTNAPVLLTDLGTGLSSVTSSGQDPKQMLTGIQNNLKSKF
jgi:multiple sugar transport system substrate-binding protein